MLGSRLFAALVSVGLASSALASGHSLRFFGNGSNQIDRVKIPLDAPHRPVDVGGDLTIEFRMKAALASNTGTATTGNDGWITGNILFDRDVVGTGDHGDWGISLGNGRIAFGVNNGSAGATVVGSTVVADGAWHHIACTRQQTNGLLRVFVDGQLDAATTGPTGDLSYRDGRATSFPNSDPFLVLGAEKRDVNPAAFRSYNGFLDEVRVSDVVRYAGDFLPAPVAFLPDDHTMALYHFDEGLGDVIHDSAFVTGGPSHGQRPFGGAPPGPLWTTDVPWEFGTLAITLTQVVSGVTNPVDIQNAGDGSGRLFIVERPGRIRVIQDGQLLAANFLDIAALIQSGGEVGLRGLGFDPGYQTNGQFFVYHTNNNGSSNVVARYTASPPATNQVNPATRVVVLEIPHPTNANHNGGQLQFGPDGYLYIGPGDGGSGCDPPNNAQTLTSLLGKLLRVDIRTNLSYRIPPTNPFANAANLNQRAVWAYGLRNPWRFSFDRLTGDILIADVGQGQDEEVNFQPSTSLGGENYGWRCFEGVLTNTCSLAACGNFPTVLPVLHYAHSGGNCSIAGGYRYRGTQFPPLTGYYLYGDYCTGIIWAGRPQSNGVWTATQLLDTALNFALVSFGQDEAGELYVADLGGGRIYRIIGPDQDLDGLPDWFELAYFGNATAALPDEDSDGDGQTNREELTAGTSPVDAADALRVTRLVNEAGQVRLRFQSAVQKRYRVQYSDAFPPTSWSVLTNGVVGTGGEIEIVDPAAAGKTNRFYRAVVTP